MPHLEPSLSRAFGARALTRGLAAFFALFLTALAFVAPPTLAQEAEQAPAAQQAEGSGKAPLEEEGPEIPAAILDPATERDDLVLLLSPLTRDELAAAAEAWLGIVKEMTEAVVAAQVEARGAEGEAADAARDKAAELSQERLRLFDSYTTVIDAWERKSGDPDAIAAYRAYRSAIIVEEAQSADFETLLQQAMAWLTSEDGGLELVRDIVVIIASFFALLFVARMVRRIAARSIDRVPNLSMLLKAFLVVTVYWVVLAIGLMVVLTALGVDVSPVFALIGGASFILAFALQSTLGNLASGMMIMINRPFDVGDYVQVAGVAGTVQSVSIMSTTVTTPDNQVIVIPNSNVWGDVITNVTTSPTRRVDLVFGIGYGDDIETAQRVFEETVAAHPLVLKDPEPVIRVSALGASSVDFIVRPWVNGGDYWAVQWDLTRQVKEALDAAGISIPFPQQDVHVHAAGSADAAAAEAMGLGGAAKATAALAPEAEPSDRMAEARHSEGLEEPEESGSEESGRA